jgi:hypothetical protein
MGDPPSVGLPIPVITVARMSPERQGLRTSNYSQCQLADIAMAILAGDHLMGT